MLTKEEKQAFYDGVKVGLVDKSFYGIKHFIKRVLPHIRKSREEEPLIDRNGV